MTRSRELRLNTVLGYQPQQRDESSLPAPAV
jgi:hypothetical protein